MYYKLSQLCPLFSDFLAATTGLAFLFPLCVLQTFIFFQKGIFLYPSISYMSATSFLDGLHNLTCTFSFLFMGGMPALPHVTLPAAVTLGAQAFRLLQAFYKGFKSHAVAQ